MILNGALAGLVAITADPASPGPLASTIVGLIGGIIVVFSIITFDKLFMALWVSLVLWQYVSPAVLA
jgi:ammonia channel protein AmtB